jgi:hypothetical protein
MRKIAFILEEFAIPSPGQQLLDRFLIGYPREGQFHRVQDAEISLCLLGSQSASVKEALQARVRDFGLKLTESAEAAVANADASVLVWKGGGAIANEPLLDTILKSAPAGSRCFVHGTLANTGQRAKQLLQMATERRIALSSGTTVAVTFRLPDIPVPRLRVRRALIIVQGSFPQAEFDGLEGILPFLQERGSSEGIRTVQSVRGDNIWKSNATVPWSRPLLAAAVSRSNTIQGDPVKDGRPQDIVGLGLVEKLAKDPRAWLLTHSDGAQTGILVLDGALEDYNVALELQDGTIFSTQLYRPPRPNQEQFSRLATKIEEFLLDGKPPWPKERGQFISSVLEMMAAHPL